MLTSSCFLIDLLELHNVCEDILQDVLGNSLRIASVSRVGGTQGWNLREKETVELQHLRYFSLLDRAGGALGYWDVLGLVQDVGLGSLVVPSYLE